MSWVGVGWVGLIGLGYIRLIGLSGVAEVRGRFDGCSVDRIDGE